MSCEIYILLTGNRQKISGFLHIREIIYRYYFSNRYAQNSRGLLASFEESGDSN